MTTRRLPPLSTLRAFEAAARHMSFKRAAAELGVTPTAVSHQVRQLEDWLGVPLFERRTRRVVATQAAASLFPVLRDGLDAFAQAVAELTARPRRRVVTVSATTAFTAKCLVPRVADFRAKNPHLDLRLHAGDDPVDFRADGVDVAIRYGSGPYRDLVVEPLTEDRFAPVCSPALGVRSPDDLARVPLIHLAWRHPEADSPTWALWFRSAGRDPSAAAGGTVFSDEGHAVLAAQAGQGVALLSLVLLEDDLAAGLLVQPFGPVLPGRGYQLVHPPSTDPALVAAIREWLLPGAQRPGEHAADR